MANMAGFMAGSIVAKMAMEMGDWNKSVKDVQRDTNDLERRGKATGKEWQTSGKMMMAAGAAIAGSLALITKKVADYGDSLNDMRQRTGISTEVLSSFKLAAEESGTSLDGIATGLKKLSRGMYDTKLGTGEAIVAFQQMGISVMDSEKNLRPLEDVMIDVADRFAGMADGAEKAALAQVLFGRSGADLIPMLNLGGDGLRRMMERAKELGVVMSDQTARAADKFNDSMVEMKASLQGFGIQIGTALMPLGKGLVDLLTSMVAKVTDLTQKSGSFGQGIIQVTALFGALLVPVGAFEFLLGTLKLKLPLIAAAMKTTTASLIAATAAYTALGAAVLYYIMKLQELAAEKAKERAAGVTLAEQQGQVITQLMEAARRTMVATNDLKDWVTSAAMDAIIAQYAKFGENQYNMARKAILAGEHGKALADALRAVAEESGAAWDKLKGPTAGAAEGMGKVDKQISKVGAGLAKLKEMMAELENGWSSSIDDMLTGWDKLGEAVKAIEMPDFTPEELSAQFGEYLEGWASRVQAPGPEGEQIDVLAMMGLPSGEQMVQEASEKARETLAAIKEGAVDPLKNAFQGLYNDIAQGFASAMEGMIDGTKSFADFFVSIWKSIKQAFFRVLGEMVAGFMVNFIKKIIAGQSLLQGISSALGLGGSILGAGAGAVGTGLLAGAPGAAGAIITEGGFLIAAPQAAVGAAGGAAGIMASFAAPIAFAAVWLGALFGRLFGKSAAEKWEDAFRANKIFHDPNWTEDMMKKSVSRSSLQAPPSTSTTPGIDWAGPGTKRTVTGGSASHLGDINVTLQVSALDGDDVQKVVRAKVIPVLREAARRREFWIPVGSAGGD